MIGLNKIWLNQVQLNRLYLNAPFPVHRKMAGGGSSGDGFPVLPGDVTRWHFGGLTNEMMAAMDDPRIEDADGKGRFLSFKNFLWAGMSGVNGYTENYNNYIKNINTSVTDNKVFIKGMFDTSDWALIANRTNVSHYTVKVSGVLETQSLLYFYIYDGILSQFEINKDGVYQLPKSEFSSKNVGFYVNASNILYNITIEQLPLYPGFILGDGVDDFAVTEKELNFEDTYTVYTAFIPFQDDPARNMVLCGKDHTKDFYMDYSKLSQISFYSANKPVRTFLSKGFNLFCCKRNAENMTIKNLVTGMSVTATSIDLIDNPGLYFLWKNATHNFYSKAAIAGQIIDNGHFTTDIEDENVLNWYKKQYSWLFPDQAWTVTGKTNEDTDRATIANITGNGNNLVLSNFGFAENSGYGLYAYNFNSFTLKDNVVKPTDVKNDSFRIVGTGNSSNVLVLSKAFNSANWKIRVTGMKEGDNLIVGNANKSGDYFTITKDGIYTFQKQYEASSTNGVWYNSAQETDVLVEQIPEYEGYLVTDGVDDKIISSNFKFGENYTVVGEWKFLQEASNVSAGFVKNPNYWILYNYKDGINAYIKADAQGSLISGVRSIKASTSKGDIYPDFNSYVKIEPGKRIESQYALNIAVNSSIFTKLAFKNLAIYPTVLSKEDCIKAYNYLQTLKAK